MTTIARICEKWTMELPDAAEPWFADWVMRSPKQAGKHLTAGWLAYQTVRDVYFLNDTAPPVWSVHECFGGMGAQALMIEELFKTLDNHTVGEISWEAVQHLERVLPDTVHVSLSDAYREPLNLGGVDLVGLDFGDLTVWRTREGEDQRYLLNRVFAAQPKAVVFTDIACRYLHLHRERYETVLGAGTCGSYEDYLRALLRRMQRLYGYTPAACYYDRWSTVTALVPQGVWPYADPTPTPDEPVGLELF